jgi:cbb3-type cytochrome oxidase maturation protein
MNIIFFMIGVSLLMALGFLFAFLWAMKNGQNDDLHTPAMRILFEEKSPEKVFKTHGNRNYSAKK